MSQIPQALRRGADHDSIENVEQNIDVLYKQWDAVHTCGPAESVPRFLVDRLKRSVPGFRLSTYRMAAGWVFFWHHLK